MLRTSLFARWVLALVCIASFSLMFYASRTDSAIDDELAHIPAGYGYVHNLDYRLNPEHPPLIKALAMLPVLFLQPVFPAQTSAWNTEVNGQWDMGGQFLYQVGNDANAIIQTARIIPIIITILLILLVYAFARRMMGSWWALLPASLVAFDPTILAHGHYVTTDVGAAAGVLLALFFFVKFAEAPSAKTIWLAGLAFGIAQITKFSTPLVTVLFIFLTAVLWLKDAVIWRPVTLHSFRRVWHLILIILIGYIFIVYPVYFLFTFHYPIEKQISDTTTILTSFAGGPAIAGQLCNPMRCLADADIWMAKKPITRPFAQYLLGLLMVIQRADGGNTIYFLGHVVDAGGIWYFPILFLLKTPLPTLIIIFLGFGLAAWNLIKKILSFNKNGQSAISALLDAKMHYLNTHFTQFSMLSFIVLYWGYSMHSPLNIGIRHIIPTLPLIYILAANAWKHWVTDIRIPLPPTMMLGNLQNGTDPFLQISDSLKRSARSLMLSVLKYILLITLLVWLFLETLIAAPYFLSYFNELGGGMWGGYHYVTDSNYDWGQDLLRLQTFVTAHPKIDKIAVDYFGGGNPHYYLGDKEIDWQGLKGNPADKAVHWFAVSIGQLEIAKGAYAWLNATRPPAPGMGNVPQPDYRVGTSIFVYRL